MEDNQIKELSLPIYSAKGWMKFLGVMYIISGALVALSIIGIVVAWIPIWIGVLLFQSASAVERANTSGEQDALMQSLGKIKTYFVINGVLMLIALIFYAIMFFVIGAAGIMGMSGMEGIPG